MAAIPEHDDEALKEVEDFGFLYFDYAKYLNPEKTKIIAYKRWGRGYMKVEFDSINEVDQYE